MDNAATRGHQRPLGVRREAPKEDAPQGGRGSTRGSLFRKRIGVESLVPGKKGKVPVQETLERGTRGRRVCVGERVRRAGAPRPASLGGEGLPKELVTRAEPSAGLLGSVQGPEEVE